MTTTWLDPARTEEITAQARSARPGRVALTVVAGVLFGVGWAVAKLFHVVWLTGAWVFTAVRLGWRDARGNQPSRASLREDNARMKQQLQRLGVLD